MTLHWCSSYFTSKSDGRKNKAKRKTEGKNGGRRIRGEEKKKKRRTSLFILAKYFCLISGTRPKHVTVRVVQVTRYAVCQLCDWFFSLFVYLPEGIFWWSVTHTSTYYSHTTACTALQAVCHRQIKRTCHSLPPYPTTPVHLYTCTPPALPDLIWRVCIA